MTISEILALSPDEAYKKLTTKPAPKVTAEDIAKQYDPLQHDVFDESKRPKKTVKKASGKDANGNITYTDRQEEVARIAVPLQKLIVERTIGFVLGNPVKVRSDADGDKQTSLFDMVKKLWKDNKLDYLNRELARTLFSECEVAELWYLTKDEEYWENASSILRPKCKLLKPSDGNKLIPLYDEYGDMVAFSREYVTERDGKKLTILETYTAEKKVVFEKGETITVKSEANPSKKIPVVYYQQSYPEWHDVQVLINRFETLLSNFADTNDYFGSPMIAAYGKVLGFAEKGEQGKIAQVEKDGKLEYLSWDQAPDSVKLEIETLLELIFTCTQTPNISFSQMKGLGNLSGVALKLMFMDPHMKVENKIELFGEMFQRRLNLIKAICSKAVDTSLEADAKLLNIEPVFKPYMPRNEKEEMETLTTATGGKAVLSRKTAIANNLFVSDPEAELEELLKEEELASQQNAVEPAL